MYEFSAPFQRPDWRQTPEMLMMALLLPGVVLRRYASNIQINQKPPQFIEANGHPQHHRHADTSQHQHFW